MGYMYEYRLAPGSEKMSFDDLIKRANEEYQWARTFENVDAMVDIAYFYDSGLVPTENPFVESLK